MYGLAEHPCTRCGTPIVREQFMNRLSYFCPVCQRKRLSCLHAVLDSPRMS
ncbi:zinc finger domain-containing protein [Glutamicibacter sp. AOP5-A2-7]